MMAMQKARFCRRLRPSDGIVIIQSTNSHLSLCRLNGDKPVQITMVMENTILPHHRGGNWYSLQSNKMLLLIPFGLGKDNVR